MVVTGAVWPLADHDRPETRRDVSIDVTAKYVQTMGFNMLERESSEFGSSDASRRDNAYSQRGLSQGTRLEGFPTVAPWSKLSWGLFLPLVFGGNVVVATLAWIIVGLVMR
jgi:hypothetical protein